MAGARILQHSNDQNDIKSLPPVFTQTFKRAAQHLHSIEPGTAVCDQLRPGRAALHRGHRGPTVGAKAGVDPRARSHIQHPISWFDDHRVQEDGPLRSEVVCRRPIPDGVSQLIRPHPPILGGADNRQQLRLRAVGIGQRVTDGDD